MTPKQKFSDLLYAVGNVEGIDRVRFATRCGSIDDEFWGPGGEGEQCSATAVVD